MSARSVRRRMLFISAGNVARAPIAVELLHHVVGGRCQASRAGTSAAVPPPVLQVMAEPGIDWVIADPAAGTASLTERLAVSRRVRDELRGRIARELLTG